MVQSIRSGRRVSRRFLSGVPGSSGRRFTTFTITLLRQGLLVQPVITSGQASVHFTLVSVTRFKLIRSGGGRMTLGNLRRLRLNGSRKWRGKRKRGKQREERGQAHLPDLK